MVACQGPQPMGFSRQEYWRGLLFPSPGNLPNPGIEPWSPVLQADSLLSEPPGEPLRKFMMMLKTNPLGLALNLYSPGMSHWVSYEASVRLNFLTCEDTRELA